MYKFSEKEMEHLVDIFRNYKTWFSHYKPREIARSVAENHEGWMNLITWTEIEELFCRRFDKPHRLIKEMIEDHYDRNPFHPQLQEAMIRAAEVPLKLLKDWE